MQSFLAIEYTLKEQADIDRFADSISTADMPQFVCIQIDFDPFPAISVLINGDHAWIMYLRHSGDAGFHSINPAIDGTDLLEFQIENGQVDHYPLRWTFSSGDILNAIVNFARTKEFPDWIEWANDSGDGCVHPRDEFYIS